MTQTDIEVEPKKQEFFSDFKQSENAATNLEHKLQVKHLTRQLQHANLHNQLL